MEKKSKVARTHKVKPLPGARTAHPASMSQIVVNLREEPYRKAETKAPKKPGRRAVVESYEAVTQDFMQRLRKKIKDLKLEAEVADYGETNPFPVVTVTCSAEVAKVIAEMPEVEGVYRDDEPTVGFVEAPPPHRVSG